MELRQLRYFLKAKELLNFTEAANAINISQSTLSQQIKQLEEELGVPLFNRIGKRISLTDAGKIFSEYAQKSLLKSNEGVLAIQDLQNLKSGELHIGVSYGMRMIFVPILKRFAANFKGIALHVVYDTTENLNNFLTNSQLDFILSFKDDKDDERLFYTHLFQSKMSLVTKLGTEESKKTSFSLKQISEISLVMPSREYSTTNFILDVFNKAKLNLSIALEVNDIPTLLEMVKTGLWSTILAESTIIDEKELSIIPIKSSNMLRTGVIIEQKESYKKKSAEVFKEMLINSLFK